MTLARAAAACFIGGLALILLVDVGIARIVGVPLTFVGLVLGVTAIASPAFLEADRDAGEGPPR